ncbi:hypothetical protein GON26_07295 [Flavobacterium sp. GA093]|uniref:Uncharacterized protein n=1 Tax=Flavobacterium hydrocarbonoxydans TaxID=2683249 RepID=A0A6I4NJJ8_9FLAO|nr:hypothetical protein [Flavobacterium hydrocarbonoxydans]MWB94163.1 hypothetical protein [Flavobacterium hydrocarbonoxydans]
MANYDLKVGFTTEQLQILHFTESNVVLAKGTRGQNSNVAWQVFRPFQSNQISWDDEYGIYCSNTKLVNHAQIIPFSDTPIGIDTNTLYTLENNGVILGPTTGGQRNTFALRNNYSNAPYLTTGLFQNAIINGNYRSGNAISAIPVLFQSTALMDPATDIYIWIQSQVQSNSIITRITSPVTRLSFSSSLFRISVVYDSYTGRFINAGSSNLSEGTIEHIEAP